MAYFANETEPDQEKRKQGGVVQTPGGYPQLQRAVNPKMEQSRHYMPNNGEPIEPPEPKEPTGTAGGSGDTGPVGATGPTAPATAAPRPTPAAGNRLTSVQQTDANQASQGSPGLGANLQTGDYRNLSNFLGANKEYAKNQAREIATDLEKSAASLAGKVPSWSAYSGSQNPVAGVAAGGTATSGSGTGTRPAPATPSSGTTPTKTGTGTGARPPPPAGGGVTTPGMDPNQPTYQAQAGETAYKMGQATKPMGLAQMTRGGTSGERNLDAYLMGADPGAQQYFRDLQGKYGGLMGLVQSGTPYGTNVDATGKATLPTPAARERSATSSTGTTRPTTGTSGTTKPTSGTKPGTGTGDSGPNEGDSGTGANAGKIWNGTKWVAAGVYNKQLRDERGGRDPKTGLRTSAK